MNFTSGDIIQTIFLLLILFQLKHYLADYPLQNRYMMGKFKTGTQWIIPLGTHALVHGAGTALILLFMGSKLWWLIAVDFAVHFTMDRIKASPHLLGRWKPEQPYFWWVLGFDQMVHHLTHYFIIYKIVRELMGMS